MDLGLGRGLAISGACREREGMHSFNGEIISYSNTEL